MKREELIGGSLSPSMEAEDEDGMQYGTLPEALQELDEK